jgi:hypothetical protein
MKKKPKVNPEEIIATTPLTPEELEVWNFAHNLLAMNALSQDLSQLEHAGRLEIESVISHLRKDLQNLIIRTKDDRNAYKKIESTLFSAVAKASKKFQDPRLSSMFDDLSQIAHGKAESNSMEQIIEEDVLMLRSALDKGSPDRIQRAVAILKSDLNRLESGLDPGLYQRAKLLLAHYQKLN